MKKSRYPAADLIKDHSKELAVLAENEGHECLAHVLRMAELEARRITEQTHAVLDAA